MYLYFIQSGDKKGPIKIGIATSVEARLKDLQIGNPKKLSLIGSVLIHNRSYETMIHDKFVDYRIRGEWFEYSDKIIDFINKKCDIPEKLIPDKKQISILENNIKILEKEVTSLRSKVCLLEHEYEEKMKLEIDYYIHIVEKFVLKFFDNSDKKDLYNDCQDFIENILECNLNYDVILQEKDLLKRHKKIEDCVLRYVHKKNKYFIEKVLKMRWFNFCQKYKSNKWEEE